MGIAKANDKTTRIEFMEKHPRMEITEYHCVACSQFFFFIDYVDDTREPRFCPCCGRRNLKGAP